MPEYKITEEELEGVESMYKWLKRSGCGCVAVKELLDCIEAERKPKGYLEKELEKYRHTASGIGQWIKDQGMRDIARIFDEEKVRWLGNATKVMASTFTVAIEDLKRRIVGEGE